MPTSLGVGVGDVRAAASARSRRRPGPGPEVAGRGRVDVGIPVVCSPRASTMVSHGRRTRRPPPGGWLDAGQVRPAARPGRRVPGRPSRSCTSPRDGALSPRGQVRLHDDEPLSDEPVAGVLEADVRPGAPQGGDVAGRSAGPASSCRRLGLRRRVHQVTGEQQHRAEVVVQVRPGRSARRWASGGRRRHRRGTKRAQHVAAVCPPPVGPLTAGSSRAREAHSATVKTPTRAQSRARARQASAPAVGSGARVVRCAPGLSGHRPSLRGLDGAGGAASAESPLDRDRPFGRWTAQPAEIRPCRMARMRAWARLDAPSLS